MKLKARRLPIGTGDILIAIMTQEDATNLDLNHTDRILIKKGRKKAIATLDISNTKCIGTCHLGKSIVKQGEIGLFEETQKALGIKDHELLEISIVNKPKSIYYIKKKLKGKRLKPKEIEAIVKDIGAGKLMDLEIAYFVSACYIRELNTNEIVALTKAMIKSGEVLKLRDKIVVDKHCIGGVAANRTSMVVVPIIAAAGLKMPKTSSRSITSAAGTSDTVEILCNVSFPLKKMKRIVEKTNGCLVWGGAVNLAPTDDRIIRVEHPVSLDPTGQLLASILAKKRSVSATHVIIDIPLGRGAKIENRKKALDLKKKFEVIGRKIGMKIIVVITDGSQPIGNGIGPALEARDVIWTLQNSKKGSKLLKDKSVYLAGLLLEAAGKKNGKKLALELIESGKAYKKFIEIIKAQGGKIHKAEKIRLAKKKSHFKATKSGKITHIDNTIANKIAKIAGAPHDKEAGIYLYKHKGNKVKKGDILFTIYSDSSDRLKYAKEISRKLRCIEIN